MIEATAICITCGHKVSQLVEDDEKVEIIEVDNIHVSKVVKRVISVVDEEEDEE